MRGVTNNLMRLSHTALPLLLLGSALPAQRAIDLTGRPDAAIKEPFTSLSGIRELPGGRAIVTDQVERAVFVVDFASGTSQRIGTQGDGPREYRFPLAPLRGGGDSTWIVDATARRALLIRGSVIESTVPMPTGGLPGGLIAPHGSDRSGRAYFEGNGFDPEKGTFVDSVGVVRWTPPDRVDVLARVHNGGRVRMNGPMGVMSIARVATPFAHIDAWAPLPDGGVAIVRQSPFRVDLVGADKAVKAGAPIAFTAIAITQEEKDSVRERTSGQRVSAVGRGGGAGNQVRRPPFPDDAYPEKMPAFIHDQVHATPEGELWVGRSHRVNDKTWRYDIFSAAGSPAGAATLKSGATVVGFGAGVVYVTRTDPETDLVYLERYRR